MKYAGWVVVLLIIVTGGWYYFANQAVAPTEAPDTVQNAPSSAAGINGSANQGNLGQPDNGQVQSPEADDQPGAIIGDNLALGTDGTAKLGTYLVGYTGMPVYIFDKDNGATSTCYDACATTWPPYIVSPLDDVHQLKSGVKGAVGTTTRTDGQWQMTYNGKPLYFFAADKGGNDATGDGKGGAWHVAKP